MNDVAVGEGDIGTTPLAFTVSLDYPSGKPVSVDWTASGASAAPGSDFTAASGTVNFPPDEMVKTITLNVTGDTVFETDETLAVDLSSPVSATVNDGHGVGTITNDDAQPTLSIDDVTVAEGNAGTATATFHVSAHRRDRGRGLGRLGHRGGHGERGLRLLDRGRHAQLRTRRHLEDDRRVDPR